MSKNRQERLKAWKEKVRNSKTQLSIKQISQDIDAYFYGYKKYLPH